MLTLVCRERLLLILCHSVVAIYVSFLFQMLGSVLPEDDAVSAETCRSYLVNNTNIQLYLCI